MNHNSMVAIVKLNGDICIEHCGICGEEISEWVSRFNEPSGFPLVCWENIISRLKKGTTNILHLHILQLTDTGTRIVFSKQIIWTRATSVQYESSNGWKTSYKITEDPICFVREFDNFAEEDPTCLANVFVGKYNYSRLLSTNGVSHTVQDYRFDLKRDAVRINHIWLMQTVQSTPSVQTNFIADITIDSTPVNINWGFNGANAVMLFRKMCKQYRKTCKLEPSGGVVVIHFCKSIGAWMQDNLSLDELHPLIQNEVTMNNPKEVNIWSGSIVI